MPNDYKQIYILNVKCLFSQRQLPSNLIKEETHSDTNPKLVFIFISTWPVGNLIPMGSLIVSDDSREAMLAIFLSVKL